MTKKELEDCLAKHFAAQPDWDISRIHLQKDVMYTLHFFVFTIHIFPYKGNWIVNFENDYITCKTACDVIKTIEGVLE